MIGRIAAFLERRAVSGRPGRPLALEDAAERLDLLETCVAQPLEMLPPRHFAFPERNPFLETRAVEGGIRGALLRNMVLDRDTMTFLQSGRPVTETAYLQSPQALDALSRENVARGTQRLTGIFAACFDHWDQNYFHWIAHTIPALYAVSRRREQAATLILPAHLKRWQADSIELLGCGRVERVFIDYGERRHFERVYYSEYVRGAADFSVSPLSREAYAAMVTAACAGRVSWSGAGTRLYVRRDGRDNRRIPNEGDLMRHLEARGFQCVDPETMTLAEQIRAFHGADMVVGMLGAGLANLAWCRAGTVVYELVPSHHVNPCFAVMATQGGLRYWADVFDTGIDMPGHEARAQRPVDIERISARLDELEVFLPQKSGFGL